VEYKERATLKGGLYPDSRKRKKLSAVLTEGLKLDACLRVKPYIGGIHNLTFASPLPGASTIAALQISPFHELTILINSSSGSSLLLTRPEKFAG
jgi:hypothetical protein